MLLIHHVLLLNFFTLNLHFLLYADDIILLGLTEYVWLLLSKLMFIY